MIGHNNGPTMEPGTKWRTHCWTTARARLLPHIPIEILRGRLKRAAELGLDYRTYAGIRATTGRDIIAVLYSSNALCAPAIHQGRAAKLAQIKALRVGLATPPLAPESLLAVPLDAVFASPCPLDPFARQRDAIRAALGATPRDGAVLIGAYGLEKDWVAAAQLAGYVDANAYFSGC
jgi:hypothetical protein